MPVTLGLERLLTMAPGALRGRRIGLVTNHTGVDRLLRQNVDLLLEAGCRLTALFGPEHGVRGTAQAGVSVADARDPRTGLPVYSLYGQTKKPTPEMLAGVDLLCFDMADIGVRYYTYPYTMALCMEAARDAGIPCWVLDRPNPLGGTAMEGNLVEPGYESFAGRYPIPIRHGMTMGELAWLFNQEFGIGCELAVIPCAGWRRSMYWEETGHLFVPPSPNAPELEMALLYGGTCLFEGTNWSEGRGTTKPFQMIGAPWADGLRWADRLNGQGLPGVRFRPVGFTPTFSKHAGIPCEGVQVHVTDREACRPVLIGLLMLETAFRLWPEHSAFRGLETDGILASIDRLAGTAAVRTTVESGGSIRELYHSWAPQLEAFARRRAPYLLYA